jgi:transcriptional regulator with GAF, ATPase, and Fis domain
MGEGVTGKVMQTGKAMTVLKVSQEPLFLNRFERWNVTKQDISFICVPISIGSDVVGTISVDRPFDESASLEEESRLLGIVADMIAIDLKTRRQAAIERQLLEDENRRLLNALEDKVRGENRVGQAALLSSDDVRPADHVSASAQNSGEAGAIEDVSLKDRMNALERDLIIDALIRCEGNLAAVARYLKTTARVIRYKVKELEIDYKQYCRKKG